MSDTAVLEYSTMAEPRDRIDLRAEPEWIARIKAQASRLGMGASAYIRMAVTLKLEADEADEQSRKPRRRKVRNS